MQGILIQGEYSREIKKPPNEIGPLKLEGCRKEAAGNWRRSVTCIRETAATGQSQISEKCAKVPHEVKMTIFILRIQKAPKSDYGEDDKEGLSPPTSPFFPLPCDSPKYIQANN